MLLLSFDTQNELSRKKCKEIKVLEMNTIIIGELNIVNNMTFFIGS